MPTGVCVPQAQPSSAARGWWPCPASHKHRPTTGHRHEPDDGYHHISGAEAGPTWMVAGHYTIRLVEHAGAWQIAALTLTVFYQEGNIALLDVARTRADPSPRT